MNLSKKIGVNDDCTVGYLINNLLHTNLTIIQKLCFDAVSPPEALLFTY